MTTCMQQYCIELVPDFGTVSLCCKKERTAEDEDNDDDEGDDGGHCSWIDEISVSSVWVSPGLISTGSTVSLLGYLALTFARTTERATGIICRIIFYATSQRGGRSRGVEVESTEER